MDELHLSHHFGWSFRAQFKSLKTLLFNKLRPLTPILLMTAMCSLSIVKSSEELFGFHITEQHWPSISKMANRKESFHATYSTLGIRYVKKLLPHYLTSVEHDIDDEVLPSKVMFYSNTATLIKGLSETLEEFMDTNQETRNIDVLLVHVNLSKEEKAAFIGAFTNSEYKNMNFKIMCSTSGVANAGIDSKDICAVFRLDLPPSIFDLVQEMGRAGRRPTATGEHYHYHLFFSIEHFIYLYKRILNPEEDCDDETYRYQQICDLYDVIRILANPFQCHKQLIEMMLGNPYNNDERDPFPACGMCTVCRCDVEMWPALIMEGVQLVVCDVFNTAQGKKNLENIKECIKNYPDAQKYVFGINSSLTPKPIDINKMSFLLIAAKMIDLTYEHNSDDNTADVTFSLVKVRSMRPRKCIMEKGYWTCIMMREPILNYDE